jgi:hypothetical protein
MPTDERAAGPDGRSGLKSAEVDGVTTWFQSFGARYANKLESNPAKHSCKLFASLVK